MAQLLLMLALFFVLLATGGFIVYIIKQQKIAYTWSYRILFVGFIFHTISLCVQYYAQGIIPVLTFKAALSFFAWTVLGAYLVFHFKFKLMVLGSFVAPLAACLMIISSTVPGVEPIFKPTMNSVWLTIHILTSFIGNGLFAVTFVSAIMYLTQERQLKKKRLGSIFSRLPSLETLDLISYYSLTSGIPFLTLGMITGAVYAQYVLGTYWSWDPKEVWSLITWLFYAVLLHERLVVGWRGRKAAFMSIIAFLILIFSFVGVSLYMSDYHSFQNLEKRITL